MLSMYVVNVSCLIVCCDQTLSMYVVNVTMLLLSLVNVCCHRMLSGHVCMLSMHVCILSLYVVRVCIYKGMLSMYVCLFINVWHQLMV